MMNFFKGIFIGIGGISPGLSGSVLLVIFGLYEKTLNSISTFFKNFKKSVLFLLPLFAGCGIGVIIFSKIVNFLLINYEMQTRFTFLGLVLGTVPLFYREVKKEGFSKKYYILIAAAAILGIAFFTLNSNAFPQVQNPNLFQSVILGVAVAGSSIVPGVDSAVILSSLGLYELYVNSIAELRFDILLPAGIGLVVGGILISIIINFLIKRFYTITFSIIFGLFISIIPRILNESCTIGWNADTVIAFDLALIGFIISFYLGDIKGNNARIKKIYNSFKLNKNRQ